MKGEIFMNQEIINVELLALDTDTDILRFYVGEESLDVNLNSPACQGPLKDIFSVLLRRLIHLDIKLELSVNEEYKRAMYIEVCTEYINDLNRELADVKDELRSELSK
jgi:hypothetical protein